MNNNYSSQYLCLQHSGLVESIRAISTKLDEREKQVNNKFEALERSVSIARGEMDRRLEGMNEFRSQLESQTRTFLSRRESDARHLLIDTRSNANSKAIEELKMNFSRGVGAKQWTDYLITVGVSALVYVVLHFAFKA